MKLSEAIEVAKKRAAVTGRVGYAAHPTYDVWATRSVRANGKVYYSMDIRPRVQGSNMASNTKRVRSKEWRSIVAKESTE